MKIRFLLGVFLVWVTCSLNGQVNQDQVNAFNVCTSKSFHFETMKGPGEILEKAGDDSCFGSSFQETNSKWLHWKAKTKGKLVFTIIPKNEKNDLDFLVFNSKRNDLSAIRCMASGQSLNRAARSSCFGPTGLAYTSVDVSEMKGCQEMDDSFLKYIEMDKGDEYFLLVNNYNSDDGFTITFESTAELEGHEECVPELENQTLQLNNIYPIPAQDKINLEYTSEADVKIDFVVYNMSGVEVLNLSNKPTSGTEKLSIDIQSLPAGEYIISALQNGNHSTKQFMKI